MPSSTATAAAGNAGGGGGAQQAQTGGGDWRKTVVKSVMMYAAVQALTGPNGLIKWYRGKTDVAQPAQRGPLDAALSGASGPQASGVTSGLHAGVQQPFASGGVATPSSRLPPGTTSTAFFDGALPLDFYIFVTSDSAPSEDDMTTQQSRLVPGGRGAANLTNIDFSGASAYSSIFGPARPENLLSTWTPTKADLTAQSQVLGAIRWSNITLQESKLSREADLTISVPHHIQSENGSIWAEIMVSPAGEIPTGPLSMRKRKLLTRLYPERKIRHEKKLFEKAAKEDESSSSSTGSILPFLDKEAPKLITYWHKNLTLAIVDQAPGVGLPVGNMPPPVLQHILVKENDEGHVFIPSEKTAYNFPVVFPNDFWHMREHMHPINTTHDTLPLHVSLYSTSFFKFQLLAAMSDSFDKQPGLAANEVDMIKLTLLENSPWYLGLTVGVSLLHSLFEFLAFSSEVSHWRKKDNMAGVSLGSILTNVIVQLIILLYLLDQAQDTSWMILASQAVGIVIEAWKLTKAVTVGVLPRKKGEGIRLLQWLPYRLDIRDKHVLSEEERKTQEFDKLAFRIVSVVAIPLLGGYTIYSALYNTHKGWWSFTISTLCSFVYMFGFVSLIPQLIVNYKLKSTAGMNSKTFVYKILGTFVDDLFAFAIRQPWLHRLACFRDDIIFMVFLYQRWIYGVDPTRVNEYGQVLERKEGDADEKNGEVGVKSIESKKDK